MDRETWENRIGFLRLLSDVSGFASAFFAIGKANEGWTSCPSSQHPCLSDHVLRSLVEQHAVKGSPFICFENDGIFYGVVPVEEYAAVIGPAAVYSFSKAYLELYAQEHGMMPVTMIPSSDLNTLIGYMNLAFFHFTGNALARENVPIYTPLSENWHPAGDLEAYQLDQSENDRAHQAGVIFEKQLLEAVESGDMAKLKSLLGGPTPDFSEIGAFSDAQKKEYEYLAVSIITLLTRSAVAGGARVETAHALGDVFLKRLSNAVLRGDPIFDISYSAMIEFTELVQRAKAEKSDDSYVDACKAYIEQNLRKDLQVGDIAPAIGLSRTYLSRLFHQAEGVTVQQYIQREKCRHAARMLQYSDYTIAQIAQYYGFSSQSYFGTCFQTWYGMTPNAYRKANR